MSIDHAKVIINPVAGGYSAQRIWSLVKKGLTDEGLLLDDVFTEGTGHAIELAREAANRSYRLIITVGGDGTVNEVVNGILDSNNPQNTALGMVSAGTTCSFARSVGIPSDPVAICNLLISRNRQLIDIGLVEYIKKGKQLRRFFINEADVGFGATVVEASNQITDYLGRKINYLNFVIGGLTTLVSYKNKRITLCIESETEDIYDCAMLVIANGTHFGGGMRIAPDAKPDDGLLDMVVFGNIGKSELLRLWPMTYKGRHISHDEVRLRQIRQVDIKCDEKILVEADGEFLGEGPVAFSVVPSALNIVA